jgi:hypothetical protein
MVTDEEFAVLKKEVDKLKNEMINLTNKINELLKEPKIEIKNTSVKGIEINVEELSFIKGLKSALDKCLSLLNYTFEKNPLHPGLTPDEMVSIFREKFGMPIPLTTISSQLLSASGNYVTRTKIKEKAVKYRYQILPKGQEYIKKKIEELLKVEKSD